MAYETGRDRTRAPSTQVNLVVVYVVIGLLFQLLYHGFPWPLSVFTWLHVLLWPVYVVLGMLRWIFYPFALVALLALGAAFVFSGRRT